ncbi:MAG: polymer-forming cytoskeletal protein [Roseburia sp.]|nr:polymer-forming cytoskeletal protein [Roseburia sp.]
MSFFKELKEDIAQSVNELSDSLEESVGGAEEKESGGKTLENEVQKEMDSILEDGSLLNDMSPDTQEETIPDDESEFEDLDDVPVEDFVVETEDAETEEEIPEETGNDDMKDSKEDEAVSEAAETDVNSEETTVITKGTTINGGIKSDTSLEVKGVIEGDVECQGKLTITGRVAGNSKAAEIYVNTPRLEGNLESRGSIKIDVGTVVIGSISSASVVVAGAVKGDIEVNGPIIVDSTAVVQGSIIGKSVQINSGAVIDGNCSLKYADVDLDTFFE